MATISHGHEEHHGEDHHDSDVDVISGTVAPEGSH